MPEYTKVGLENHSPIVQNVPTLSVLDVAGLISRHKYIMSDLKKIAYVSRFSKNFRKKSGNILVTLIQ